MSDHDDTPGTEPQVPDERRQAVAWVPAGWAVVLPDGTTVTVSDESPVSATVWQSLDEAMTELDGYADEVAPRRRVMGLDG